MKTQYKNLDISAEKANVKLVVDKFEQFWETQDMTLLSRIFAHDTDMINSGTDAAEYFVGWEDLKESIGKMLPSLDNVKITVANQIIKVHYLGNVAWFSQIWDWDFVFEGQPVHSAGQRLSGVLEKRNGNWVFVQFHNSVPVSG